MLEEKIFLESYILHDYSNESMEIKEYLEKAELYNSRKDNVFVIYWMLIMLIYNIIKLIKQGFNKFNKYFKRLFTFQMG